MDAEDPTDAPDSSPETASEEAVGYGKPPRHSRFKPGCSGNPRGRPKGAASCKTIVQRLARQEHELVEHGRKRRRTTLELILIVLRMRAAEGNARALAELTDLLEKFEPGEFDPTKGAYIFMNELLSEAELEADYHRSMAVQQQELEAWEARRRLK
jgi:hypothetical protein